MLIECEYVFRKATSTYQNQKQAGQHPRYPDMRLDGSAQGKPFRKLLFQVMWPDSCSGGSLLVELVSLTLTALCFA